MYFLGYGQQTKAYQFYDLDHGKVIHSCDVKYNYSEKKENEMNNDPFITQNWNFLTMVRT